MSENEDEPLLQEQPNPYVLSLDYHYPVLQQLYKDQVAVMWVPEEINYEEDMTHWAKLAPGVRRYIKQILAGFLALDLIVGENILQYLQNKILIPEAQNCYVFQAFMERIHAEVYSRLLHMVTPDAVEKHQLFNATTTQRCLQNKAEWCLRNMHSDCCTAERVVVFACVETLFFASSFGGIFWVKTLGLMKNLTLSNEFISRDEGMHTRVACEIYKCFNHRLPPERVHALVREAVDLELEFVDFSLQDDIVGLAKSDMYEYVRVCADVLCSMLGVPVIYEAKNPFGFIRTLTATIKPNFFEGASSRYAKAGESGSFEITAANEHDF